MNDALIRTAAMTFPAAVQAIAALEDRIAYLRGTDEAWAVADCHAALACIRIAFDVWPRDEAQLDAAHEALSADLADLADAEDPPLAAWAPGEITQVYGR